MAFTTIHHRPLDVYIKTGKTVHTWVVNVKEYGAARAWGWVGGGGVGGNEIESEVVVSVASK